MKVALALVCYSVSSMLAGAPNPTNDLQLVGIVKVSNNVGIFVAWENPPPKFLGSIGASIGPYRWTAVDVTKGYADFVAENGDSRRLWLPEAAVRSGSRRDDTALVSIPPLESLKGLIGLEEALLRRPDARAHIEKRVLYVLNKKLQDEKVPWEERSQALADLMNGKGKMFLVPEKGVDASFAKKYNMTSEEVEHANWGSEIGEEFKRTRSMPAKN